LSGGAEKADIEMSKTELIAYICVLEEKAKTLEQKIIKAARVYNAVVANST